MKTKEFKAIFKEVVKHFLFAKEEEFKTGIKKLLESILMSLGCYKVDISFNERETSGIKEVTVEYSLGFGKKSGFTALIDFKKIDIVEIEYDTNKAFKDKEG